MLSAKVAPSVPGDLSQGTIRITASRLGYRMHSLQNAQRRARRIRQDRLSKGDLSISIGGEYDWRVQQEKKRSSQAHALHGPGNSFPQICVVSESYYG